LIFFLVCKYSYRSNVRKPHKNVVSKRKARGSI
jgi:hypothetical protein